MAANEIVKMVDIRAVCRYVDGLADSLDADQMTQL